MEKQTFEEVLTLYLIRYVETYRNSYDLIKVLARKFGIINYSQIINSLIGQCLIIETEVKVISHYQIVEKGIELLKKHKEELICILKDNYSEEKEYIELLIKKSY